MISPGHPNLPADTRSVAYDAPVPRSRSLFRFSVWVTSTKRYWVILAKHRSAVDHVVVSLLFWSLFGTRMSRVKGANNFQKLLNLPLLAEDPVQSVTMHGSEWWIVETIDGYRAMLGDLTLQHGQKLGLRGTQWVTPGKCGEARIHRFGLHSRNTPDQVFKAPRRRGVKLWQRAEIRGRILGQNQGNQRVQIGGRHRFAAPDLL